MDTKPRSIVYVVQEPRYKDRVTNEWKSVNLLPAIDYGKLVLLLETDRQINSLNAAQLTRVLTQKLGAYTDADYILAAGDPVAIGVACAVAAKVNHHRFTVLKWDKMFQKYFPVTIDLGVIT